MKKILLGALLISFTTSPLAREVFDRSNFAKNTVTAAQQVKQTAIQTTTMTNTVNQYLLQLQNLKQLNPSIINEAVRRGVIPNGNYSSVAEAVNAAQGVYRTYQKINDSMVSYGKTYENMNGLMGEIQETSSVARVSPERIINYDFQRSKNGITEGKNYYNQLIDLNGQLEQHQKRADLLSRELPAQNGTVQLLQTLGAQNTLLQDQLSHLIQVSTISASKAVEDKSDISLDKNIKAKKRAEAVEFDNATREHLLGTKK